MAEDNGGSPLPRRVPGTKRGPGTGPLARPVLSDSDLQRIRAALDSAQAQAPRPRPSGRHPCPGEYAMRARERAARTHSTAGIAGCPAAHPAEEGSHRATSGRPRAQAGRGDGGDRAAAGGHRPARARRRHASWPAAGPRSAGPSGGAGRAARSPGRRQGQPGAGDGQPGGGTGRPEERAGRPGEGAAPWDEGTAPPPEAGTPETPPPPPQPAPPKSAPPTAPASPPPPARPRKRGRGRAIITGSAIATLVLLSAGSALLLTRHAGTSEGQARRQRRGGGPRPRRGLGCHPGRPGWPGLVRSGDVPGAPGTRRSRC